MGDFRINERIFRKGEEQSKDSKMSEVLKIHFERDKTLLELAKEGYETRDASRAKLLEMQKPD